MEARWRLAGGLLWSAEELLHCPWWQVDGLDPAFVRKLCEFRTFSHLRWPPYTPQKLPKETKLIVVWADRSHLGHRQPCVPPHSYSPRPRLGTS